MDLFDLADYFEDISKEVKSEIEREVHKSAKLISSQAKTLCPVGDTGYLRNSISTSVKWRGNTCVGVVSADAEYSPYTSVWRMYRNIH